MKLRHKLSNVIRNLVYLSQLDYKRALADRLSDGRRIEHNAPNDLRHCPICGAELERTVQQGFIIPFCPKWHIHPTKLAPFPDVERFTDKVPSTVTQQPPGAKLLNYLRETHSDAGPETTRHRAVQFPRQ